MPKIVIDNATKYSIIKMLADNPDGLTLQQINQRLGGVEKRTLAIALAKLPCVYIDRWQFGKASKPEAVWCVPDKPPKPPMPTKRSI